MVAVPVCPGFTCSDAEPDCANVKLWSVAETVRVTVVVSVTPPPVADTVIGTAPVCMEAVVAMVSVTGLRVAVDGVKAHMVPATAPAEQL